MRHIILSMHTSLDGFVAGDKGEMDWILIDDEIFTKEEFFRFSYQISKIMRRIKEPEELYGSERFKMIKQYGEQQKDDKGNLIDRWLVTKRKEEYNEAVKSIDGEIKIEDVSKIKLSLLQKLNIGANTHMFIAPIIEEDINIEKEEKKNKGK